MTAKSLVLRIVPLIMLSALLAGCKTVYYQLADLPVYAPLDEKSFSRAEFYAVHPFYPGMVPVSDSMKKSGQYFFTKIQPSTETRLLKEMMKKHGYNVYDYSKCISMGALSRLEHVVQVISLDACRLPVDNGVAVTYRLVVMVRPKYVRNADNTIFPENRYFFQAYHRFTISFDDKNKENRIFLSQPDKILNYSSDWFQKHGTIVHPASSAQRYYFKEEFVRPVFENLFRNPDFRKALEPGFLERDRKIFAEAAAYPGPSAFRPADYWSKTGISLPKPKPAMRQRDAELTARLTGRWVAAAFVLKQIERESDGKMQEKSQMVNDQVMEFRPNGDLIILTPTDDKLTIQAGQWKILNGDLYMVLNKDLLPSKQRLVFKSKSEVELVMDPVFLQNVLEQQQKRLGQKIRYKVMTGRDGRSVDVEAIEKSSSVLIIFPNNVLRKSIPGRLTIPKGK